MPSWAAGRPACQTVAARLYDADEDEDGHPVVPSYAINHHPTRRNPLRTYLLRS